MVNFSGWLTQIKRWNRSRKQARRRAQIEPDYSRWRRRNPGHPPRSKPTGLTVALVCFVDALTQLRDVEKAVSSMKHSSWRSCRTILVGASSLIAQRAGCWSDAMAFDVAGDISDSGWLAHQQADWFCFCAAGCMPTSEALEWVAEALRRDRHAAMIFGDAELDTDGSPQLFAKPEIGILFQIHTGYMGDVLAVRASEALKHGASFQFGWRRFMYQLGCNLLCDEPASAVRVPRVLARCTTPFRHVTAEMADMARACYARLGVRAELTMSPSSQVLLRQPAQSNEEASQPLVSVIIPTRDRVDLLKVCVESLLQWTNYPALEVLIVDNGSIEEATHAYLRAVVADQRVRVIRDDDVFNYSRLNNTAAGMARGRFLLLLNNDIEVRDAAWLQLMVDVAQWPHVGCVGARLHYPCGQLQHAGLVLGSGGGIAHVLRASLLEEGQAHHWAAYTHEVSAVTGACLLISRENYEKLGGLNARDLGVAFNDVDLCLRAKAAGLTNIYVGEASLVHHESISRGGDNHEGNVRRWRNEWAYMRARWGKTLMRDFYVSPHYARHSDQFELSAKIAKW